MSGVQAALTIRRGSFDLALDLTVAPGEIVALIGPNGAGKTTALHALAGLLRLSTGWIRIGDRAVDDPGAGIFVPTERRRVGVVFQDYLLFPHLTALDNVAFGLRTQGRSRAESREAARTWLERVGVARHAHSRPAELSGGQAQRVALARALVTHPRLLLLDEPLAALDAGTRMEIRSELTRHLRDYDGATLLVTHDPLDAMAMASRIVVLEGGRVVQDGPPVEVARAPRTEYVATLVGLNLHRGRATDTVVQVDGGGELHVAEPTTGPVLVSFPPSAVTLHVHRPEGSARNVWPGRIVSLEQQAHTVRVQVDGEGHPTVLSDVTALAVAELDLAVGAPVWVSFKAAETHVYPA